MGIMYFCSTDCLQVSSIASSLSTRQLLRIARRLATYPAEDLEHSIHKACLARYSKLIVILRGSVPAKLALSFIILKWKEKIAKSDERKEILMKETR